MRIHHLNCICNVIYRNIIQLRKTHTKVLGIETSCDDTGCAIVDGNKTVLGECLQSQKQIHLEYVINWLR